MTFPWRQLPWLQNKGYPNPGRSSENDSADTQGFGRKMTEGQRITSCQTSHVHKLATAPSGVTFSQAFISNWDTKIGVAFRTLQPWPNPCALISTCCSAEPPWACRAQTCPAKPSASSKCSNTGSSLSLHHPDNAFSTGLPQGRMVSTAGLWALLWGFA